MKIMYLLPLILHPLASTIPFPNVSLAGAISLPNVRGPATHIPPLVTAVMHTNGPVLELGCGVFSTPLLHAICSIQGRLLVSADTSAEWLKMFRNLAANLHQFVYVPVYEDDLQKNPNPLLWGTIGNDRQWAVVLVDHRPGERRRDDILRLRRQAQVLVVHDTEEPGYGYNPVLATFPYSYTYTRYGTTTTLVSDFIDIAKWFDN